MYWLIEPEMSSSATIGGIRVFGPRYLRSMKAPPALRLERNVRRMSMTWPWRCGESRRVRSSSSGSTSRAIASLAAAISAVVIWAKSFLCRISFADMVSRASTSISGLSRTRFSSSPANKASWTRWDAGFGASVAGAGTWLIIIAISRSR